VGLPAVVAWEASLRIAWLAELRREGQAVAGTVRDKGTEHHSRGDEYWLRCDYVAAGTTWTYDASVPRADFLAAAIGGPVEVWYFPARPSVCALGPIEPRISREHSNARTLAVALVALLGGLVAWVEWVWRRQRALARHGLAVTADVAEISQWNHRGIEYVRVSYTFCDGEGQARHGTVTIDRARAGDLHPGGTVLVLCDPRRPRRHRPACALACVTIAAS